MKIRIKVKPSAKEEKIEKIDEGIFRIWVKDPPEKGRANQAIIRLLSSFFNVSQTNMRIVAGKKSRNKIVAIDEG